MKSLLHGDAELAHNVRVELDRRGVMAEDEKRLHTDPKLLDAIADLMLARQVLPSSHRDVRDTFSRAAFFGVAEHARFFRKVIWDYPDISWIRGIQHAVDPFCRGLSLPHYHFCFLTDAGKGNNLDTIIWQMAQERFGGDGGDLLVEEDAQKLMQGIIPIIPMQWNLLRRSPVRRGPEYDRPAREGLPELKYRYATLLEVLNLLVSHKCLNKTYPSWGRISIIVPMQSHLPDQFLFLNADVGEKPAFTISTRSRFEFYRVIPALDP